MQEANSDPASPLLRCEPVDDNMMEMGGTWLGE